MIVAVFIVLGLLIIAIGYIILIYNRLVNLKHETAKAWSNIDVLLKQRHDELPKLVETCKQYMRHEKETLDAVMRARSSIFSAREQQDLRALGNAEGQLRQGLMQLFAAVEAYPDLKASAAFRSLEARITSLENAISDRREFYNECVNTNNIRLEEFPDLLIARFFGFESFDLLEFADEETANVDLRDLFGA
jgi:LemA protein